MKVGREARCDEGFMCAPIVGRKWACRRAPDKNSGAELERWRAQCGLTRPLYTFDRARVRFRRIARDEQTGPRAPEVRRRRVAVQSGRPGPLARLPRFCCVAAVGCSN